MSYREYDKDGGWRHIVKYLHSRELATEKVTEHHIRNIADRIHKGYTLEFLGGTEDFLSSD